jgi:hypothetical protein
MQGRYRMERQPRWTTAASRSLIAAISLSFAVSRAAARDGTNDFYDDAPTVSLGALQCVVGGEVTKPGPIDFSRLPLRSVICKETRLSGDSTLFVGAYRYDGYALYDILNTFLPGKKNEAEFRQITDLYVTIDGAGGRKAVLSWGEIFYPANRYQIMIATRVARIVPSKTKELWPLPGKPRLITGPDLVSARIIDAPAKITVHSYGRSYPVKKNLQPLISGRIKLYRGEAPADSLTTLPAAMPQLQYPAVFYGRGQGIHGITAFSGVPLKEVIAQRWPSDTALLQRGLIAVAAADGYRCIMTYGEVCNRNDQAEVLLVPRPPGEEGGAFSLFIPADFFSDRAVKAISEIRLELAE